MRIAAEVAGALAAGRAVVALESTIISHGLPRPDNERIAADIEGAVRAGGAVPATIAVVAGEAHIGLDAAALHRIASGDDVAKASLRDLAPVAAAGRDAATTVAATAHLAARAGIGFFATGGLGGVHRQARESWDESADLAALATLPTVVVCSGVKSILDVGATLERLESLNVAVVGYRTDRFPGFYLADSGFAVDWRVDSPAEIAAIVAARRELGTDRADLVLEQRAERLDQLELQVGGQAADVVVGLDVGRAGAANVALVLANARLAAEIAVAAAAR